ncbi:MAG: hypothetical protein K0S11_538 [Gammaproteobacteria bacterium]|jgi:uncharacterized protein involved in type VI secretion and phage assembly|nr:hypothetical protein [Gammaproteobacteria bacterium]
MRDFFGKYRGKVVGNRDPKGLGRLQVRVPAVLGDNSDCWAMPSVPYAGLDVGLVLLPPENANIWVEFEGGNINHPIWTGCFWGEGEYPAKADKPEVKLLKLAGITLQLDDTANNGAIQLKIDAPAVAQAVELKLDKEGLLVTMSNTTFKLTGTEIELANGAKSVVQLTPAKVDINQGALEVM